MAPDLTTPTSAMSALASTLGAGWSVTMGHTATGTDCLLVWRGCALAASLTRSTYTPHVDAHGPEWQWAGAERVKDWRAAMNAAMRGLTTGGVG